MKFSLERRNEVLTDMMGYIVHFAKQIHVRAKMDVSDAVNEIFMSAASRLGNCEDRGGHCRPLVKMIIRRSAWTIVAHMQVFKRDIPNMDHVILEEMCLDPYDHEVTMMMRRAGEIADSMGGKVKDIFYKHYMMDDELKEVAEKWGLTTQSISYHHMKFKNALKEEFA